MYRRKLNLKQHLKAVHHTLVWSAGFQPAGALNTGCIGSVQPSTHDTGFIGSVDLAPPYLAHEGVTHDGVELSDF